MTRGIDTIARELWHRSEDVCRFDGIKATAAALHAAKEVGRLEGAERMRAAAVAECEREVAEENAEWGASGHNNGHHAKACATGIADLDIDAVLASEAP